MIPYEVSLPLHLPVPKNELKLNLTMHAELAPSGSFISEASFSRAPLNSRLPPISPHRVTIAATAGPSRARQSDIREENGHEEEDELTYADTDEEEVEMGAGAGGGTRARERRERRSRKSEGLEKEPLAGLASELQEALIVEDLLFVLMVRRWLPFRVVAPGDPSNVCVCGGQGIEGQYIEYDPSYRPEDEFERLQGAQFVIDPSVGESNSSLLPLVHRFLTSLLIPTQTRGYRPL